VCGADAPSTGEPAYGLRVEAPFGLDAVAEADTVIAMPWGGEWGGPKDNQAPPELLAVMRAAHERGARMLSFCTGAAGSFELALHVVRLDHGAEVADAVARALAGPRHRDGGQAQYVAAPVASDAGPDPFRETLDWALEHLHAPLSVAELANRSLMSARAFARHFRAVVGTTPHRWLLRQRVLLAQQLLETTEQSVERIADAVGFGSAATLRMHFQRIVHTTPLAYRRTFPGVGVETEATG
jgi:transcriptional regulator GlxA family with amidase domain